jgi:hypothetical protein
MLDLLFVHSAELLATAIGFSVIGEAQEHAGVPVIFAGLVAGALLVFVVGAGPADGEPDADAGPPVLPRLGGREIALNGPAFVALGAGLAAIPYVQVPLLTAVVISNYLRAIRGTTRLRRAGVSVRRVFLYWILIGACLCGLALLSFSVLKDSGDVSQAFVLASAAGAMMAALPALEPSLPVRSGTLGFVAALRFALAFLLASFWAAWM